MKPAALGHSLFLAISIALAITHVARAQNDAEGSLSPERVEARRLLQLAQDHEQAEHWALATQTYLELHAFMQLHSFARAPVALWNAGLALSHVPGREREAAELMQRFLDDSNTPALTEASDVRDWRSD